MSASPGRLAMPRRRGTASGLLILLLGAWGALVPFVGPYFDWTVGPDTTWDFSSSRLVLQALPGVVAFVGGLLLMGAANRGSGVFGALLTIAGGAWFVVGPTLSALGGIPDVGQPLSPGTEGVLQSLSLFTGLGALLCVLGGMALARVTARLEGDRERLVSGAPAAAADGPRAHEPQRDRAVAPARREDAPRRDESPTRVAADDAPTRTAPVSDEARGRDDAGDTRVLGDRGGTSSSDTGDTRVLGDRTSSSSDEGDTRVLGDRGGTSSSDTGDTRVLGDRTSSSDSPPPPDPGTRAG